MLATMVDGCPNSICLKHLRNILESLFRTTKVHNLLTKLRFLLVPTLFDFSETVLNFMRTIQIKLLDLKAFFVP